MLHYLGVRNKVLVKKYTQPVEVTVYKEQEQSCT
jgi:hypothetical protein